MSVINQFITKIFGSRNDRLIKQYNKVITEVNNFEESIKALSDTQLKEKTNEFKSQIEEGKALDDLLPEAFAVVREASLRVLGLRHYDVQIIGGIVLHQGNISEMKTGEGKTLMATLAAYLNALSGKGVHIVTVNDYLASRDSEWMGKLYHFLGLSVSAVVSDMAHEDKKNAYLSDIIYATNNELGFDYLRDNMVFELGEKVQRPLNFAIVDEVDSILIDEARTPLIISGPMDDYGDVYQKINTLVPQFTEQKESGTAKELVIEIRGDYTLDEKQKQIHLTDDGHQKAEELLSKCGLLQGSLYDSNNILLTQHLNASLRAHKLYQINVDYIIDNDEVVIIDEFTGRTLSGRRWSEGLHQAIEAKEGVSIKKENQTLASITFQNYFRLYKKLSGMTGTADTESFELNSIYSLEVVLIPPNIPVTRKDFTDVVYLTQKEKYEAIIEEVKTISAQKRPILVGTNSIESSELVSDLLTKLKIKHEVLNAKQHQREAEIVANAGVAGAITIATNMAGRGTDIVLGGRLKDEANDKEKATWQIDHDEVVANGGLHIIGAERNESRRVDNQLRGRAGRQGDPGSSRFFLSLEDGLMRIFASDKMASMMQRLGLENGEAIEHKWINKAIENAQKKVEAMHFDSRKQVLEYDDVANEQRKFVYKRRNELIGESDIKEHIDEIRNEIIADLFAQSISENIPERNWDIAELERDLADYSIKIDVQKIMEDDPKIDNWLQAILKKAQENQDEKEALAGYSQMRLFEKSIMLQTLDHQWKEHLAAMDYLRQSIGLRGFAQKNPVQEYKHESFEMFKELLTNIDIEVTKVICNVEIGDPEEDIYQKSKMQDLNYSTDEDVIENVETVKREEEKVGRNDPCPCGSGKKFKKCHGANG
jgi:preprotein translocase subunit SecA